MSLDFIKKIISSIQSYKDSVNDFDLNQKKILQEYKNTRHKYEEFCYIVHKIIESFLDEGGYKYHIVSRTKTFESLQEKIIRKKTQGKIYNYLDEIEDLAGNRIIFYSEGDKEKFLREINGELSGIINIENRKKHSGYEAVHLIMTFGSKRLKLSEYKKFKGLKSELQVTSIFYHAWSEIEHDFIYKDIYDLKKNNPEKFEKIKEKLAEILEKYIKKASIDFEKIMNDIY